MKYKLLAGWLPLAVAVTLMSGLVYAAVQQDLRQSANDPQIQLAEDAARNLDQGSAVSSQVGSAVNVAASLSPAMVIYDSSDRPKASSLTDNGASVNIPRGVLDAARKHGRDIVTWQTGDGTRLAAVAVATSNGQDVVVSARSLREVERRENALELMTVIAWALTLAASFATAWWLRSK